MPLDATSVATSMSALPLRNFVIDCSRRCCDMSPSMATELKSILRRSCATSRVRYFVEQNTMDCNAPFCFIKLAR